MIPIPGGTFEMGSPSKERGRKKDEGPVHEVTVRPFWMSKTEVTWAEYSRFLDIGVESLLGFIRGRETFLSAGGEAFARLDCLNDSPEGMHMLEALVRRELAGWLPQT